MSEPKEKISGLPFVFAGLSFIPLLGVPLGIVAIVLSAASKKQGRLKVVLIASSGICFTMFLYGSLFYFGFVQRGGIYDDLRKELAQSNLNTLVQTVEFYKVQHGEYPESLKALQESLPRNSMVFVIDPSDIRFLGSPRYFYYERVGHDHYYLRGVGPDGIPFTSDDILPQIKTGPETKLGLLLERVN